MKRVFYLSAIVVIAVGPVIALPGCAGVSGVSELSSPPALFEVTEEFTAPDGTLVQTGTPDGDATRVVQRQVSPDGTETWYEKGEAWIPGAVAGVGNATGYGVIGGIVGGLAAQLGIAFSPWKKKKSAAA